MKATPRFTLDVGENGEKREQKMEPALWQYSVNTVDTQSHFASAIPCCRFPGTGRIVRDRTCVCVCVCVWLLGGSSPPPHPVQILHPTA